MPSKVTEQWLRENKSRCILAKVGVYKQGTGETFFYLSTRPYITTSGDTMFLPIISGGLQFAEGLNRDGTASSSWGDLEINNPNGEYDSWFDDAQYIWVNRPIQLYYGDPEWVTTDFTAITNDFELVFNGIILNIDARNRTKINIKIRDKMEQLNTPVTEEKLGTYGTWGNVGGQTNKDEIKPLVFGEVHNTTPMNIDPSTLEYMVNSGPTEELIEVRDNGVPIYTNGSPTATGANVTNIATLGKFKLLAAPAGTITTSVKGIKNSINLSNGSLVSGTYSNNIANLVALITTQYGKSYLRLTAADLDLTNLSAFASANTQPVGILIKDNTTVKAACASLTSSIGASIYFNRLGKLQILRFGVPTSDPNVTITDNDIIQNSLNVQEKIGVIVAAKIGYCKNWTVQKDLTTGIPKEHKDLFAEEWLVETSDSSGGLTAIKDLYKLNEEPDQKNTMLITQATALAEANRLTAFYSVPKTIYTFVGTPRMQILKLGQPITIYHNRFNMSAGKTGQVVALGPNWSTGLVNVGVLI
jgi:hypothetical protein